MSLKVKRGLGLLVVALIAFLVVMATQGQSATPVVLLTFAVGLAGFAAAACGLVLLAWGLLRD
jgi:hypothetical protein